MELEAAKMIGAGLAAIALAGAGVGIGIIFGNYLSGAMRNPSAAQKQFPNLLLGLIASLETAFELQMDFSLHLKDNFQKLSQFQLLHLQVQLLLVLLLSFLLLLIPLYPPYVN